MRGVVACVALAISVGAQGSNFQDMEAAKKQVMKVDRCSHAAFIAVSILEQGSDDLGQALAMTGALAGLQKNEQLAEAKPTDLEVRVASRFADRESIGMTRPFGKQQHDWLVAQAAAGCVMWMPLEG
ncbi:MULTISPECIES: hypothetical protein [unclassified Pseudomonas]|uniref:hypothetical protein n=1 Tax=unclassified Pseudomonas TaxID=196821 RepID=UPI00209785A1|nr:MULTISPECIES: hypothetical protein [unclassified Pseudomonas]MCO7519050.1 hypothetical protein [Pseudomonas sp. 1]MCO7539925.1 hypothetical protein [Pseudomonas sp. VA159-2]